MSVENENNKTALRKQIKQKNISTYDAVLKLADTFLPSEGDVALSSLKEYIKTRVAPGIHWYQKKGDRAENGYLAMQIIAVTLGAVVPVLVNLNLTGDAIKYATTLMSLSVVIVVALEGVLHFRERYRNYRSTAHALEQECFSCFLRAPPYDKCGNDSKKLCLEFAKKTESYIGQEVASTLKTMTVTADQRNNK
ncbi:MAG TPA: DUF4231 domain-containing protein [Candidatus Bathyarchaeia archaeon]|nr:DUF4231 domain-containing protein [Candidatus Bathyarchaeia archaeon]